MNWKIAIIIIAIVGFIIGAGVGYEQTDRWVGPDGSVHYNHPDTDYEIAVEEVNDIVPVYEEDIPEPEGAQWDVQGQTWFIGGQSVKVIIEHQTPAVVYHEMFHAMHNYDDPENTEPNADAYATERGFPIHDATY
jgi:hypothetical protein